MPITSAPIGRNRHMSISHRRDNPFIMVVIAHHKDPTVTHHGHSVASQYYCEKLFSKPV